MKTLIYGGTFNPPHPGHERALRLAAAALCPDRILVIPDRIPPHKSIAEGSPTPEQRLEMCRLAFGDIPGVNVSDMELKREGKSYSAYTVRELRERYPEDELFLMMGTDQFLTFRSWYSFEELLSLCTLTVVSREYNDRAQLEKAAAELEAQYGARIILVENEPLVLSSSQLRADGGGLGLLSAAVADYIRANRLYGVSGE